MNKLLSFNPEPFESDSELQGTLQEYDAEGGPEREGEFEFRRPRSGSPYSRRPSARPQRAYAKTSWWQPLPKLGTPPEQEPTELPSEYVRWVQSCLNQFLGLRLPLDGIMSAATRSAVRMFQERKGLPIDGLVGPETGRTLADACRVESPPTPAAEPAGGELAADTQAGELPWAPETEWESGTVSRRRRTPSRPAFSSTTTPTATAAFDSQAFRQNIVRIANQELARWGNGAIKETDPRVRRVLQDYWQTGTGNSYSEAQLGNPVFQNDHPWSAAFISWVMRTAGAGTTFRYSSAHSTYIKWAKDNRLANNDSPFKAYRITELAPQVGDLVCKRRAGSGATYDNIRLGMKTHCDIVTEVQPGRLVTIGGNVNNSVAPKTLRTDANGFITDPEYFAVIRIGGTGPSTPSVTPPTPVTPSTSSVPRLLKQESTPPGTTLYVEIDLGIVDKFGITASPMTVIFIPEGYMPGAAVDLILYLHGHKDEKIRRQAIDQYWNSQRFPYGAFRESTNASGRNVILVAPTLGSRSETGRLLKPGGLDAYLNSVLAALRAYGPHSRMGTAPGLGNLILACHSGGGWPMRQLAGGRDQALTQVRECWGFDCTYNRGDDAFWAGWARARPNARVYIYYISGSKTAPLSESLRRMSVSNAIVQASRDGRHNYVPITYWKERVQGTNFVSVRSRGSSQPVPPIPGGTPGGGLPTPTGETPLAWGARVSPAFRRRVRQICAELGCDPNHLMAVMAFESGETFSPSIRNRLSGATGLIQFMPLTARRLGTTTDALAAMTAEQQLDYVARYFAPYKGRLKTLEDVYMVVLWPRAVGAPNETVLFAAPSKAYEQNKGLDRNRDGAVTKFEAAAFVRDKLNKGLRSGIVG